MHTQTFTGRNDYDRVYFPQMCSMKTEAINSNDITRTGTGPLEFE
jgi:hypothetical protein